MRKGRALIASVAFVEEEQLHRGMNRRDEREGRNERGRIVVGILHEESSAMYTIDRASPAMEEIIKGRRGWRRRRNKIPTLSFRVSTTSHEMATTWCILHVKTEQVVEGDSISLSEWAINTIPAVSLPSLPPLHGSPSLLCSFLPYPHYDTPFYLPFSTILFPPPSSFPCMYNKTCFSLSLSLPSQLTTQSLNPSCFQCVPPIEQSTHKKQKATEREKREK